MMKVLIFLSCFSLFAFCRAEPLHGPNVNPANLPVLIEWEKFTGRKADIIGDNFSAHTWSVFHEALEFRESGQTSAIAEQLRRGLMLLMGIELYGMLNQRLLIMGSHEVRSRIILLRCRFRFFPVCS